MRMQTCAALLALLPLLAVGDTRAQNGMVVVAADDLILSNTGFRPSTDRFVANILDQFNECQPGSFLAYSDHLGLGGSDLANAVAAAGHEWTLATPSPLTLEMLLEYDGVFLGGYPADNQVLTQYVNNGGNVYVYAGAGLSGFWGHDPLSESNAWNAFLADFGLAFEPTFNFIEAEFSVTSDDSLFAGVGAYFIGNGQSIVNLEPDDPAVTLEEYNGDVLLAVYREAEPPCQRTIFVDDTASGLNNGTSWTNAFVSLQDALAASVRDLRLAGADLWVAAGTYTPDRGDGLTPGDRELSFDIPVGRCLYGGFADGGSTFDERDPSLHATVLSGDLSGNDIIDDPQTATRIDNSRAVVTTYGREAATQRLLDGFIVRGGYLDRPDPNYGAEGITNSGGAAIRIGRPDAVVEGDGRPANPLIRDCSISDNASTANSQGAAVGLWGSFATFENCVFRNNVTDLPVTSLAGSALKVTSSGVTMIGCTVDSNAGTAAVSVHWGSNRLFTMPRSTLVAEDCVFTRNPDGAIRGQGLHPHVHIITLRNCDFGIGSRTDPSLTDPSFGNGRDAVHTSDRVSLRVESCGFFGNDGAVYVRGGFQVPGDAAAIDCVFHGNSAFTGMGSADLQHAEGFNLAEGCTFVNDTGTVALRLADGSVANCTFVDCNQGLFTDNATVTGCTAIGCSSIGLGVGSSTIYDCTAVNNGWGLYFLNGGPADASNILLIGNLNAGIGIGTQNHERTATNLTVAENAVGILANSGTRLRLANTILWDNAVEVDPIVAASNLFEATYCNIQGGLPGTGNIDAAPGFLDAIGIDGVPGTEDDDLRLSTDSPCIDAGDNNAVPVYVSTDLDGNPRFVDLPLVSDTGVIGTGQPGVVDLGVYEHQQSTCACEADGVAGISVDDLLTFLSGWFSNDSSADIDSQPGVTIDDLLAFLSCWFMPSSGC